MSLEPVWRSCGARSSRVAPCTLCVRGTLTDLDRRPSDSVTIRPESVPELIDDVPGPDAATDRSRESKRQRALELLHEAFREVTEAGLSPADVVRLLRSVMPAAATPRETRNTLNSPCSAPRRDPANADRLRCLVR
jgi:hypothetical protein